MEEIPNEANTSTNNSKTQQKSTDNHEENLQERISRLLSDNDDIGEMNEEEDYEEDAFEEDDEDFDRDLHLMVEGMNRLTQNKTFSADKLREIDRKNALLMDRIMANNRRPNQYKKEPNVPKPKATSAAINRRRNQQKIDVENEILLRKIQTVKPSVTRNPK